MKKYTLFITNFLIIFVLSLHLFAQELPQGYESYIDSVMKDWNIQGCAVAIVKNSKMIYSKGFGYRDVQNKLPVTPQTLFAIGSCTKAFTSAAACILVDQGKLDLDKPIINYIPEFKMYDDYVTVHITARDLMCHRSGLPRHDLAWYGADDISRKEMVEKLRYLEPSHGFREVWQYQNGMFMAAGYLIEQISSSSWEDFVKTNIIIPLEMTSTNFSVEESQKSQDYSLPYGEQNFKLKQLPFRPLKAMGPAGSINSNVIDMSNWIIMQLNLGKFNDKQIVSQSSLMQTQTPTMVEPSTITDEIFYSTYGLGWMITSYRGHLRVMHGGNIDGFSADVSLFPKDSLGIVILTNMNGTQFTGVMRNYTVDKLLGLSDIDWNARLLEGRTNMMKTLKEQKETIDPNKVEGTEPSHPLEDYAGKYENLAYGTMEIVYSDGKLKMHFHTFDLDLTHYHYDVFEARWIEESPKVKITFSYNEKGKINKISAPLEDGIKDIEFVKIVEEKKVEGIDLNKYIGDYEIAGTKLNVTLRGTKLILSVPGQPDYELVPTGINEFNFKNLDGYSVKFNEDAGKVIEMVLNQPNGVFTAKKK
jgi:CubicO group peptidase (beta-lactamase class C family)